METLLGFRFPDRRATRILLFLQRLLYHHEYLARFFLQGMQQAWQAQRSSLRSQACCIQQLCWAAPDKRTRARRKWQAYLEINMNGDNYNVANLVSQFFFEYPLNQLEG